MYRTIVKRAGVNPLTGKKQYKVDDCEEANIDIPKVYVWPALYLDDFLISPPVMVMVTDKFYQEGTFINPTKAMRYAMTVENEFPWVGFSY
jgi:hypothetical protein